MIKIGPKEILDIRREYMSENKIPITIYFPITKYDITPCLQSPSALPGRIYGIELREVTDRATMWVKYESCNEFSYTPPDPRLIAEKTLRGPKK